MPDRTRSATPLSHLPTFAKRGNVTVVVETPKGSRNKYDYDDGCAAFTLASVLPEGMSFPYDFGFIPSTLGDDGDPLDVLVFLDAPVMVGCVLTARLVGVIEARQRERNGEWVKNDRLLAAATHARTHEHIRSPADLRPHLIEEICAFFENYNRDRGREFEITGHGGPDAARKIVERGTKVFRTKEPSA